MNRLYKIEAWERLKPDNIRYDRIFYTAKSGEIRKVKGVIFTMKASLVNGVRKNVPHDRKVYWDGYGRCYVGTHNLRKRQYDIPLKDMD